MKLDVWEREKTRVETISNPDENTTVAVYMVFLLFRLFARSHKKMW